MDLPQQGGMISAILLVAGTCIGGGMLALPVATGVSGFIPSLSMMTLCWLAMTLSALLLLEVNLWMKEGAHVITMSSTILGPFGKILSWCIYLFISYASLVAYTAAGGDLIISGVLSLLKIETSREIGCLIFMILFGGTVYLGSQIIGRVNAILFIGMIAAYCGLVTAGIDEVRPSLLMHQKWTPSFLAIPLLLTTFSFQTMLPSLTPYLNRNVKALRVAVIGGTTVTFLVYAVWQWIVLGIVPVTGPKSLFEALEVGQPITQFLREHVHGYIVAVLADYFAFFALVTSFLGIAMGLFDFLADGLKIPKKGWGHVILGLLIVIPTLVSAVYFERVFLLALDTSGGFGDTILNGIMPVLMVWIGRYYLKFPNENRVPGGKILLIMVFLFFTGSLIFEIFVHAGWVCSLLDYCKEHGI